MSSHGAAAPQAIASRATGSASNARKAAPVTSARAAASRANGAQSKGPRTAAGKARSSQNALKHGLRAQKHLLVHDEDRAELAALEVALVDDLAPAGALQSVLAARIISAAWRMARADRIEAEILDERGSRSGGERVCPGLALIRDGNGPRAFDTLLRYRGALVAELTRSLRALKQLQAEAGKALAAQAEAAPPSQPAPVLIFESRRTRERAAASMAPNAPADDSQRESLPRRNPNEPESVESAGRCEPAAPEARPGAAGPQRPSRAGPFPPGQAGGGARGPASPSCGDPGRLIVSPGLPYPSGFHRGEPGTFGAAGSEAGVPGRQLFGYVDERDADERCPAEPCGQGRSGHSS